MGQVMAGTAHSAFFSSPTPLAIKATTNRTDKRLKINLPRRKPLSRPVFFKKKINPIVTMVNAVKKKIRNLAMILVTIGLKFFGEEVPRLTKNNEAFPLVQEGLASSTLIKSNTP